MRVAAYPGPGPPPESGRTPGRRDPSGDCLARRTGVGSRSRAGPAGCLTRWRETGRRRPRDAGRTTFPGLLNPGLIDRADAVGVIRPRTMREPLVVAEFPRGSRIPVTAGRHCKRPGRPPAESLASRRSAEGSRNRLEFHLETNGLGPRTLIPRRRDHIEATGRSSLPKQLFRRQAIPEPLNTGRAPAGSRAGGTSGRAKTPAKGGMRADRKPGPEITSAGLPGTRRQPQRPLQRHPTLIGNRRRPTGRRRARCCDTATCRRPCIAARSCRRRRSTRDRRSRLSDP